MGLFFVFAINDFSSAFVRESREIGNLFLNFFVFLTFPMLHQTTTAERGIYLYLIG